MAQFAMPFEPVLSPGRHICIALTDQRSKEAFQCRLGRTASKHCDSGQEARVIRQGEHLHIVLPHFSSVDKDFEMIFKLLTGVPEKGLRAEQSAREVFLKKGPSL